MQNIFLMLVIFFVLLGGIEWLYRAYGVKAEISRKFLHLSAGFFSLLFPWWIPSHWGVLLVCLVVWVTLWTTKYFGFLPSVHQIHRESLGSVLFPLSVYGCFFIADIYTSYLFFILPILILTVSDTLAEWIGNYRRSTRSLTKTWVGSLAFALSAWILTLGVFLEFTHQQWIFILISSFLISSISAWVEAISRKGLDNVTVPFTVLGLLIILRFFGGY